MNTSKPVQTFWAEFCRANPQIDSVTPYQVWYFGNSSEMAEELANLVITGEKFATASLAEVNKIKPDDAPVADGYSVVTNFEGNPLCIIQTTEIVNTPFNEVGAQFAADEGEGDQSLENWRRVHSEYFTREAATMEIAFNEDSIICCERFKLMFPL